MPGSDLLFISVHPSGTALPKRDVRTAIQKHVMRNIGYARRGQPRPRKQPENVDGCRNQGAPKRKHIVPRIQPFPGQEVIGNIDSPRQVSASDITAANAKIPCLVSGGCRTDPFTCFPIHMNSETHYLIDYLFVSSGPRLQPIRETWLPLSLSDPALFYEILSHISRDIPALFARHVEVKQASALHSQALQSVNKRLADPVASISDGIVAAIVGFACFSHAAKDWAAYTMHMEGLQTIIKLKGGMNTINHNRILRLLLSGIDISASCFTRQRPKFPLPISTRSNFRDDEQEIPWWFLHASGNASSLWFIAFPRDPELVGIFQDLGIACMTIKSELKKRLLWQDKSFVKTYINPLSYRLMDGGIELIDVDETNFMNECCRLGALILLSKIRRRFGARVVFTGLETERLRTILEIYGEEWEVYQTMLLWTAILAALETDGEDRQWFCNLIGKTAEDMKLQSWDEVMIHASNLLWVGDILDKECDNLKPLVHIEQEVS